eukprot:5499308-Pleurochrysis_carterae.AAC.1
MEAALVELHGRKLGKFDLENAAAAAAAVATVQASPWWRVSCVRRSERKSSPSSPFNTAAFQQEASRRLSMPVGVVMRHAQRLYEGVRVDGEERGLITYMRTDGVSMSEEAIDATRRYVAKAFGTGPEWLPEAPRVYRSKAKNAQEAHEGIRPVDVNLTPADLSHVLSNDEFRVYQLIWRRAVASQMADGRHEQLSVSLEDGEGSLARASCSRVITPGFEAVLRPHTADSASVNGATDGDGGDASDASGETSGGDGESGENGASDGGESGEGLATATALEARRQALMASLELLVENDSLPLLRVSRTQHFTSPPPRFSEGALVKRLEELEVGRPSTYASILRVLRDR